MKPSRYLVTFTPAYRAKFDLAIVSGVNLEHAKQRFDNSQLEKLFIVTGMSSNHADVHFKKVSGPVFYIKKQCKKLGRALGLIHDDPDPWE
jgi:hypothetical protein